MSADELIRCALDAGVVFKVVGGKIKAVGPTAVVGSWVPRLRQHKVELMGLLAPAGDWDALDLIYQGHHFNCPTCIAAGKGYGLRCGIGSGLWSAYRAAHKGPSPRALQAISA